MVTQKVLKGSVWLFSIRIISNFLGIATTIVVARFLAPEDFGIVAIATTIQIILMSISELSMSHALIYEKNVTKEHLNTAWTMSLIRGVLIFLILGLCSGVLEKFYETPGLKLILIALGCGVLLRSVSSPALVLYQKELNFKQEFLINFFAKIVSFVFSIWIAYEYQTYWALVFGMLLSDFVHCSTSYLLAPYLPKLSVSKFRSMLSFSGWMTLSNVVNTINWNFDNLFIGKMISEKALGLYKMGNNLALLPSRELTIPLRQLLFPSFSMIKNDANRVFNAYRRSQSLTSFIVIPSGVGLACIAEPLIPMVLGSKWIDAIIVVQVLAIVFAVQSLVTLVNPLAMAFGRTKTLFYRDMLMFGIRLPLVVVAAIYWGLEGIVWARAISAATSILICIALIREIIGYGFSHHISSNWRIFVSCCVMVLFIFFVSHSVLAKQLLNFQYLYILMLIVCGGGIYLSTVYLLWYVSGKPQSAEQELLALVKSFYRKLGKKHE
ncbi:MAG: lipopolysaccharide biosynthesis protein [Gammaproteobacteria bacterium]|nr:lipopolysaccharide biosynthesis protein [Gammaproteobacteria bacterium]